MKLFQKTVLRSALLRSALLSSALLFSAVSFAQHTQWQLQISSPEPRPHLHSGPAIPVQTGGQMQPQVFPHQAPALNAVEIVRSIQAQQDQRIRWAAQRGYITEPEYRRLQQMQINLDHNSRIAYADGYFNAPEQQFVYGQLNTFSAEIDTLMLTGNYAMPYFQQFNAPIPVWVLNTGWVNGRYELRADTHHSRAFRPAPQPPVIQAPPQHVPQGHPRHRLHLRDLLEGVFR